MQQHGSKYFAHRPTLDPGVASKGQTIYFSESSRTAYQREFSKKHHESKYAIHTHPGVGSKGQIFLAHLSHWLPVSYCDHLMYVVCRQQLLQRTSPKLLAGF